MSNVIIEVIWWLDRGHNVPMDIIREIISEWNYYEPIENNFQFRECIRLWFDERDEKQTKRNAMIKKYGHISEWNTKNITDMREAFDYQTSFHEDLSRWNVSNVTDMAYMFYQCEAFNCDLSHWDVSKVESMCAMFYKCIHFQSDLSHWNVRNVKDMSSMFEYCQSFHCDLSHWNVSHTYNDSTSMFANCFEFGCDLSQRNVSQMRFFSCLFKHCSNMNSYLRNITMSWKAYLDPKQSLTK